MYRRTHRRTSTKVIQFLPNPLPTEKVPLLSNPVPCPEYLYISTSTVFLVKLTAPNKQFSIVG